MSSFIGIEKSHNIGEKTIANCISNTLVTPKQSKKMSLLRISKPTLRKLYYIVNCRGFSQHNALFKLYDTNVLNKPLH